MFFNFLMEDLDWTGGKHNGRESSLYVDLVKISGEAAFCKMD
jgi:hypothetical protein